MRPPMERLAEPEADSESSLVLRVGFVAAGAVLAAMTSSIPASLRLGDEGSLARDLEQWVVLAGLATPIAAAAILILRRANEGLRILVGDRAPLLAIGVLWWSVCEVGLLSLVGALLRKTTHHHGLAGVTFAAFALGSGAIIAVFARRATAILAKGGASVQKVGLVVAGSAAFVVVMLVGVRTSRSEGLHTAAALVDMLAFAVTSTIGSSRMLARFRPLAIAGVPVAVLVVMVGLTTLRFDPHLREGLPETAPIHAAIVGIFQ